MTNQKLIIYDFTQLYLILDELKDQISFEIINIEKEKLDFPLDNSLVVTRNKIPSIKDAVRTNNCLIGIRNYFHKVLEL